MRQFESVLEKAAAEVITAIDNMDLDIIEFGLDSDDDDYVGTTGMDNFIRDLKISVEKEQWDIVRDMIKAFYDQLKRNIDQEKKEAQLAKQYTITITQLELDNIQRVISERQDEIRDDLEAKEFANEDNVLGEIYNKLHRAEIGADEKKTQEIFEDEVDFKDTKPTKVFNLTEPEISDICEALNYRMASNIYNDWRSRLETLRVKINHTK